MRFVRARAYLRALMTQKSCAVGMRNAKLGNHLNSVVTINRPRSIYQYSNMAPRLSGQTSIFGVVFFVFKSLLGIEGKICNFDPKASEPCSNIDISNVAYYISISTYHKFNFHCFVLV